MKKIPLILSLALVGEIAFATNFVCYRYVDGKPTGGFLNVKASSQEEAERISKEKYKKLGYSLDYTKCKRAW